MASNDHQGDSEVPKLPSIEVEKEGSKKQKQQRQGSVSSSPSGKTAGLTKQSSVRLGMDTGGGGASGKAKRSHSLGDAGIEEAYEDDEDGAEVGVGPSSPGRGPNPGARARASAVVQHLSSRQLLELQVANLQKVYGLAATEYIHWRIRNKIPDGVKVFCMAGKERVWLTGDRHG